MKKSSLVLALLLFYFLPKAQTVNDNNLEKSISEIEDRIAIKNLVDTFSILADQKETQKQTLLFTEDASSATYINGQGTENGKKMKTSSGVYYHDDYILQNGHWLIAKRKATFAWQDKQELSE